jgi:hypothetical protein
MRPYPLPKDITREEFNRLVTGLYQLLAEKGLDPASHLTVGDFNDTANGTARPPLPSMFLSPRQSSC